MLAEARRQPGWKVLRSIPYLGPMRVAQIMVVHLSQRAEADKIIDKVGRARHALDKVRSN